MRRLTRIRIGTKVKLKCRIDVTIDNLRRIEHKEHLFLVKFKEVESPIVYHNNGTIWEGDPRFDIVKIVDKPREEDKEYICLPM